MVGSTVTDLKQKPTIIFCPKNKAKQLAESTGIHLMKMSDIQDAIVILKVSGTIIVSDENMLAQGWAAPPGTNYVFIEGFSSDPKIRQQAEGRIRDREKIDIVSKPHLELLVAAGESVAVPITYSLGRWLDRMTANLELPPEVILERGLRMMAAYYGMDGEG